MQLKKLHIPSSLLKWSFALTIALALAHTGNAQTVRLHGAVSLAKNLEAKKAALESQSGVKLEIVGNGAGRGLVDLTGGQADIGLLAGPLKGVAEVMNKEKPGSVDISQMTETPIGSSKVGFVTHPGAGVKSVTQAQLRDILSGKIANWKDVGGADLPIKLVLPFPGDGSRVTAQTVLLPGEDFAKGAIVRNSSKDICVVVAQLPGACAIISSANIEGNVASPTMEKELIMPWSLVVKGEPAGDIKKVIEAAKASAK